MAKQKSALCFHILSPTLQNSFLRSRYDKLSQVCASCAAVSQRQHLSAPHRQGNLLPPTASSARCCNAAAATLMQLAGGFIQSFPTTQGRLRHGQRHVSCRRIFSLPTNAGDVCTARFRLWNPWAPEVFSIEPLHMCSVYLPTRAAGEPCAVLCISHARQCRVRGREAGAIRCQCR